MIDKVGLNLTALGNIQSPNITIEQTAIAIFQELPNNAATITGGYFPYIIMGAMFLITYWMLVDKTPLGDFKYSDLRGLTITFGIVSSIGIVLLTTGMIYSWMAVVFFLLSFLVSNILLIMQENKD